MELRRYQMMVRVRDFGQTRRNVFPETNVGGQAFAAVAASVSALSEHAVRKASGGLGEGERAKLMARRALLERLEMISRTARAIAEEVPGFDEPFRMAKQASEDSIVTIGRLFVQDAEAVKGQFIGHGLPESFVTDLHALVDTFEKALREREASKLALVATHAGIEKALLAGLAAVRKLDVIVANQFHGDAVTLAIWEQERRVDHARRGRTSARNSSAVTPAPVTPPPATPSTMPDVTPSPSPVVNNASAKPEAHVPDPDAPLKIAS